MEILLPFRPKDNELRDSQESTTAFRQEFSPNSTFSANISLSSYSLPKPPTPTSSPKIRRRNPSTSSNEPSTVRRCLDLHSSAEDIKESEVEQPVSYDIDSNCNMIASASEVITFSPSPTLPVSPTMSAILVQQRPNTTQAAQIPAQPTTCDEGNDSSSCNRKGKSVIVRRTRSLCEDLIQKLNSKGGKSRESKIVNLNCKQSSSTGNSSEQLENGVTQATPLLRVNNIYCHKRSGSDGNENTRCESPRKVQSDSSYENLADRENLNHPSISVGIGRHTAPTDKLIATDFLTSLAAVGNRQSFGRQRPASFRSNVKVLPDWNRRLLNSREKANSSENLPSATDSVAKKRPELAGNAEPSSGSVLSSSVEQLDSSASTNIQLSGSVLAAAAAAATVANSRPGFVMLSKKPSTDSDDGSESSETAVGRQLGLPPRSRPGSIKKMTAGNGKLSPSCSGGIPTSQPIVIDRRGSGPLRDYSLGIESTLDSDDILVNSDDDGSDGEKDGAGNKIKSSRSSSLEMLHQVDNPTVPVIMHPSARLKDRLPSCGSPPKQVTFNPQPHVKTFEDDGTSGSSRKHHHYHHRRSHRTKINDGADRGASEIPFSNYAGTFRGGQKSNGMEDSSAGQSISGSTLILVHERHMAQMTLLMKKEVELLEEVRLGKYVMADYRAMLTELLNMKAMVVQKMQDLLKKPDIPDG